MRLAPCLAACWLAAACLAQQSPAPNRPATVAAVSSTAPRHADAERAAAGGSVPSRPPTGGHGLPVPEPSTLFLVGTGLVGVALTARRRKRPAR